ncbi:2-dehydro-3-deoxygluconokinase [Bacillus tianshenii]|uniref:2-dehydro-3-deoxygluconokinase n=1 Tax=Sutcliffiella tianshenii TaxID=1463404 RepID=A0ABS2P3M7_9BACI|nr:sugar kinase [Bacillus tianshenii]MBM7621571.1 2-dehydro-3-deoxygluconokinase [Bacillus tianshenii]
MKVVTLGELMMRLTPPNYSRLVQATEFQAVFGGGEANVAASLALFGHKVQFVTKLPENELGTCAIRHLEQQGVQTEFIARGGERIGLYFLEQGISVRPSQVIYDRKHSSFAKACQGDFDWEEIFVGADLFHTSGITLGISDKAREIALTAIKEAKERGITTSFDINYRSKLWGLEEARPAIKSILPYVDICFGGYLDAVKILEINSPVSGKDKAGLYQDLFQQLCATYGVRKVICTFRETLSVTRHSLTGYLYSRGESILATESQTFDILDRVGGGDAFAAGFLHAHLSGWGDEDGLNFALGASVLKHTISGDANLATEKEIQAFVADEGVGGIVR